MATGKPRVPGDAGVAPPDRLAAPRPLPRPAEPRPLPPPIGQSEAVARLHRRWAQLNGAPVTSTGVGAAAPPDAGTGPSPLGASAGGARIPGGVRAKVRAKVATAAAGVQQADRAIAGDLVQAVDALAGRIDDLFVRVAELESLVQDVVDVMSEDLSRLRAALAAGGDGEETDVPDGGPDQEAG